MSSSSGILLRTLQAPTAVTAACSTHDWLLLLLQDTRLTCWRAGADGLEQTAAWRAPCSLLQMRLLPSQHLMLLAEGGLCYLHSLHAAAAPALVAQARLPVPLDMSDSQVQPHGCVVSANALSVAAPTGGVASLTAVAYLCGVLHVVKASPTAGGSSMQLKVKGMPLTHALLSCHYPGGNPPELASVRVSCRVLALAWLSPAEQQLDLQGRSLLAVLHEFTVGSQLPVLHVDCVAVNWLEGTVHPGPWSLRNVHPTTRLLQPFAGSADLPPGVLAISSRGVQLCTCLGSSLSQQQQQQQEEATSSQAALAAAADAGLCVQQHDLVQWTLQGLPLSCTAVSDRAWLIGDSSAELCMLQLPPAGVTAAWLRLQPSACMAIPDVLLHVPLAQQQQQQQEEQQEEQQQLAGLLLVGSKCSSSQVLGVTQQLWDTLSGSRLQDLHHQQQQSQPVLPVLQSALLPSLAGAQAVAAYKDPSGALPEQQLLVACGTGPRGKLAAVRSGAGLLPVMLDGPELPGDAALFAISQPQPCQHQQQQQQQPALLEQQQQPVFDCMLGFSFPSASSSSVMSLQGQTFRQLQLTGLSQQEASLLLATAPGGWLVQVTAGGVRALHPTRDWELHSSWTPPTGHSISLAALCGSHLVVASGSHLTCLLLSCCRGTLAVAATAQLAQQASALNMFRLQGGQLLVAAGLWVDNTLLLMTLQQRQPEQQQPAQLQVACSVALDADQQPRSIALLPVGAAGDVLLVGSNTGRVILWQVCCSSTGSHRQQQQLEGSITLQHARAVQVGNASITLQQTWLPAAGSGQHDSKASSSISTSSGMVPCVVAHASAMVIFRPNAALLATLQQQQGSPPAADAAASQGLLSGLTSCVDVSRLCGSEACLGASPIHTPDMPHSLAWVSHSHRLCFGSIAAEDKLRWRSCGLAATPLAMQVHERSDTIVLLLAADEHAQQQQQLVVLDGKSLRVLMAVGLAPCHVYTMLQVLDLPTTSQQGQAQAQGASLRAHSRAGGGGSSSSSGGVTAAAGTAGSLGGTLPQQQQQQGQGSLAAGCLPFIVLGSHARLAAAAGSNDAGTGSSSSWQQRMGLLSVFELRTAVVTWPAAGQQQQHSEPGPAAAVGAAGSELRYELVLHGMVPLDATPASACTVVPQLLGDQHALAQQQQQQQQVSASRPRASQAGCVPAPQGISAATPAAAVPAAPPLPLLAIGSEAGVSLLRVVVDDAALGGQQQQEQLLAQVQQVPARGISPAGAAPAGSAQQQQHLGPAPAHSALSPARCYGRVLLQELSSEGACYRGVVTKLLSSSDGCIVACESLGPVTAFKALALQPDGWVQLLPVGVDERSRRMTADFVIEPTAATAAAAAGGAGPSSAAQGPQPEMDAAAAGQQQQQQPTQQQHQAILVAAHPVGLMLLQRDLQQEQQHTAAALQGAHAAWEAGRRPRPGALSVLLDVVQGAAAAQQPPWQGAGEVAPMRWVGLGAQPPLEEWVAGRAMGGDLQAWEAGAPPPAADRQRAAGDAAAAAAAAAVGAHRVPADVLGLLSSRPQAAPPLLPSAACAPAPGSMLLCALQLGLHSQPVDQSGSSSSSSSTAAAFSTGGTVLCLSASGGVSAAQLLTPQQCAALEKLQQHAVCGQQQQEQLLDLGQQLEAADAAGGSSSSRVQARLLAQWRLRGSSINPDASASCEGYDRAPSDLDIAAGGGHGDSAFGVVDGDALLMRLASHEQEQPDALAAALQHALLWQHAL